MVKCIVKIGTLQFEQGTFQQFETFEVTAERAKLFEPSDIKILDAVQAQAVAEIKESAPVVKPAEVVKPVEVKPDTPAPTATVATAKTSASWGASKK